MVQRSHNYCIVDEVDSILIDESRTPLVISGAVEDKTTLYTSIKILYHSLMKKIMKLMKRQNLHSLLMKEMIMQKRY